MRKGIALALMAVGAWLCSSDASVRIRKIKKLN